MTNVNYYQVAKPVDSVVERAVNEAVQQYRNDELGIKSFFNRMDYLSTLSFDSPAAEDIMRIYRKEVALT